MLKKLGLSLAYFQDISLNVILSRTLCDFGPKAQSQLFLITKLITHAFITASCCSAVTLAQTPPISGTMLNPNTNIQFFS